MLGGVIKVMVDKRKYPEALERRTPSRWGISAVSFEFENREAPIVLAISALDRAPDTPNFSSLSVSRLPPAIPPPKALLKIKTRSRRSNETSTVELIKIAQFIALPRPRAALGRIFVGLGIIFLLNSVASSAARGRRSSLVEDFYSVVDHFYLPEYIFSTP